MRRSFAHSAPIGEPRRRFVDKGVARFVRDARAQVAELVDALVSGTSDASRGGSSPLLGTSYFLMELQLLSGTSVISDNAVVHSEPLLDPR
jgi:hypothetical protein